MSALTAGISQSLSTFGIAEIGAVSSELSEKILEIRSFIKSTQECIRELNDRFAGDRNPKSIFLDHFRFDLPASLGNSSNACTIEWLPFPNWRSFIQQTQWKPCCVSFANLSAAVGRCLSEYQQLTEHLHQLQQTEQRLLSLAGDSTDASEPSTYSSEAFEELPTLENGGSSAFKYDSVFSGGSSHQLQQSHVGSLTPVQSPSVFLSARTPSSSSGRTSPSCSHRRPKLLKVHLPFDQHSTVEVKSGVTLREKIGQILTKRNMTYTVSPSVCTVTKGPSVYDASPTCRIVCRFHNILFSDDEIVSWATDVGTLEDCEELWVHITIPLFMSIRHRFVSQLFFFLLTHRRLVVVLIVVEFTLMRGACRGPIGAIWLCQSCLQCLCAFICCFVRPFAVNADRIEKVERAVCYSNRRLERVECSSNSSLLRRILKKSNNSPSRLLLQQKYLTLYEDFKMSSECQAILFCRKRKFLSYSKSPKTNRQCLLDGETSFVFVCSIMYKRLRAFVFYMRKSFFTLTYCDICMKPIWLQGYRCDWCNVKFHQKCWSKVPTFCEQIGRMRPEELTNVISRLSNGEKILFDPDLTSSERDLVGDVLMEAIHDVVPSSSRVPRRSGGIYVRQPVMPLMSRSESFSHYRSRSTSAPDINEPLKKDEDHLTGEVNRILTAHTLQDGHGCGIDPRLPSVAATYLTAESGPGHRIFLADKVNHLNLKRQLYKRESLEGWEIPACEVRFGRKIGSGSFGTVYKGHWFGAVYVCQMLARTSEMFIPLGPVAIKKLNIGEPGPAQLQAFKNEVAVLKKTRHVNILLFMGWVREPHLAIVTQWCEGSSLYKHLHVNEPRTEFSVYQIVDIAKQTAQGMDYLHSKNIIHRDLKSNNIFLTDDWTVKVGDFGLATVKTRWSGSQQSNQPTGSILWMAAEVIRMEVTNPYSHQSDVYSYGIVLFELTSNQLPYAHINNKDQILFMVGRGFLKPDLNRLRPDVPNALRKLIETCIRFQPSERPEMKKVESIVLANFESRPCSFILGALESISRSLPKLQRSTSEPQLYRSHFDATDLLYPALSPKTPAVGQRSSAAFPFSSTAGTTANMTAYVRTRFVVYWKVRSEGKISNLVTSQASVRLSWSDDWPSRAANVNMGSPTENARRDLQLFTKCRVGKVQFTLSRR
ncbi:LOW QUALITY PROTEIN: hypothetical protein M514_03946 [Trichuris suis]|uniref:Kinase domain protein n=1 Tax=Trichuris suis TaxID=68888 RepID=A0A085N8V1_9BILA|nr:LOW QUALITY PROTEIN: hypothetical protein M514_03946 [Trichuris suis]